MAKQTITIKKLDDILLTLYAGADTWDESAYVATKFDEWDDVGNVVIDTVPKLFGSGSYVVSKRIEEKDLTLEGSIEDKLHRSVRNLLASTIEAMEEITIEVSRTINDNGVVEARTAFITGLTWTVIDEEHADFTLTFKNLSGKKTVDGDTFQIL